MAKPVLLGYALSTADWQEVYDLAKAAYLLYLQTGKVQSGGSAAQNYSMVFASVDDIISALNQAAEALGMDTVNPMVQPNFSGISAAQYTP